MNIRASFKYRFRDMMRGVLIMNLIIIGIIVLSAIGCLSFSSFGAGFSGGYEMAAAITIFVCGIVTIREDLRLANQCGRGRLTAFAANLASLVLSAAVFAIVCQIVTAIASFATRNLENFDILSIWSMVYFSKIGFVHTLSFGEHLLSVFLNFAFFGAAAMFGVFCSAFFYRIPSKWTAVAGIAFGVFMGVGVPSIIDCLYSAVDYRDSAPGIVVDIVRFVFAGPVNLAVSVLIGAVIVTGINFLLVRRVAVRAPGEKG